MGQIQDLEVGLKCGSVTQSVSTFCQDCYLVKAKAMRKREGAGHDPPLSPIALL